MRAKFINENLVIEDWVEEVGEKMAEIVGSDEDMMEKWFDADLENEAFHKYDGELERLYAEGADVESTAYKILAIIFNEAGIEPKEVDESGITGMHL